MKRRKLLKMLPSSLMIPSIVGASTLTSCEDKNETAEEVSSNKSKNIIVSTWNNQIANETAAKAIEAGKNTIDAIVEGISYVESDIKDMSVGKGGRPDRDGDVTLDACMMDHQSNAGGVCFLSDIEHPIQVAKSVMYDTPHVLLAGEGAKRYALSKGHQEIDLLTDESKKEYDEWLVTAEYKPIPNIEMHDTIGMLARVNGNLGGGCSTSGLAYKLKGRVGDSPIIGAGLYVDGKIGACTATGMGELMMKQLSSFLVVEFMRNGDSPKEACKKAVIRIIENGTEEEKKMQVGLLAIDNNGNVGGYSALPGFVYAMTVDGHTEVVTADSHFDSWE